MTSLIVSFSIAALLTAVFAFRFGFWRRPWVLAIYYVVFQILEYVAETYLLPPDAIPIEVAYVCLPLTFVFVLVILASRRLEKSSLREVDEPTGD